MESGVWVYELAGVWSEKGSVQTKNEQNEKRRVEYERVIDCDADRSLPIGWYYDPIKSSEEFKGK